MAQARSDLGRIPEWIALAVVCLMPRLAIAQGQLQALPDEVTSSGRWSSATGARLPLSHVLPPANVRPGEFSILTDTETAIASAPGAARFEVVPVLRNPQDASLLLTGRNATPEGLAEHMQRYMQVVPGLSPRYADQKFDDVREAFSSCERSAREYRDLAFNLVQSPQFAFELRSAPSTSHVIAYERDCLTELDALPAPVRAVAGVLISAGGAPWCSATIIGPDRLLTARHCFVDAENGVAYDAFRQMAEGRIGFRSIDPHHGHQSFSTAWMAGHMPSVEKFGPTNDFVVLKVTDWPFERWAQVATSAPTNAEMPIPAWIVGSNATLGDVARARTALEFTRGSPPNACSVLEITANGCLYHSCQTGEATSGAGVLTVSEAGNVTILGVHNAAIAGARGCEAEPPVEDILNLAIEIGLIDLE